MYVCMYVCMYVYGTVKLSTDEARRQDAMGDKERLNNFTDFTCYKKNSRHNYSNEA